MKLTIEPTTDQSKANEDEQYSKITIERDIDHVSLPIMIEDIIVPILVGWGYPIDLIKEYIKYD